MTLLLIFFVNLLGLIVFSDTESDDNEEFKLPKKERHKITNDDDDDFSLSPKPSTSKGLKGSNDSKCSKGKFDSWIYSPFEFLFQFLNFCCVTCVFTFSVLNLLILFAFFYIQFLVLTIFICLRRYF